MVLLLKIKEGDLMWVDGVEHAVVGLGLNSDGVGDLFLLSASGDRHRITFPTTAGVADLDTRSDLARLAARL